MAGKRSRSEREFDVDQHAEDEDDDYLTMSFDDPADAYTSKKLHIGESMESKQTQTGAAPSSKAAQMMAKMGYKQGDRLGASGSGLKEALVAVDEFSRREGIGHQAKLRRAIAQEDDSFRQDVASSSEEKRIAKQLRSAQNVAETLYRRRLAKQQGVEDDDGIRLPDATDCPLIWRELLYERREESHDDEELETWLSLGTRERLTDVLEHLREEHHYCFFCGCEYEDEQELAANCGGVQEKDHE